MNTVLAITKLLLWIAGIKTFHPITGSSKRWKHWVVFFGLTGPCPECAQYNGKIYAMNEQPVPAPLLHPFCKCSIEPMPTILCGTATMDGIRGADFFVRQHDCLPSNYMTSQEARLFGWKPSKGNLRKVLPKTVIGGDVFNNKEGLLPAAPGRVWYEADINYLGGFRATNRILYSNDGLMFATYDHYKTFFEII